MNSLYYWAIGALALYVAARTLVILKRHIVLAAAASVFMAAAGLAHPFLMAAGLTRPWEGTMHTVLLVSGFAFTFSVFFAVLMSSMPCASAKLKLDAIPETTPLEEACPKRFNTRCATHEMK